MVDLIAFAFQPVGPTVECGKLVRPLAVSLLRQLANWLERNVGTLSLEPVSYHTAMQKNRARQQLALTEATTAAAMFYLTENAAWLMLVAWPALIAGWPCPNLSLSAAQDDHGCTIPDVLEKFELKHVKPSSFAFKVCAPQL